MYEETAEDGNQYSCSHEPFGAKDSDKNILAA